MINFKYAYLFYSESKHQICVSNIVLMCSVMSDPLRPCGLQPTRPFGPWDFLGKNTGVGCHFLLQGIFPTRLIIIYSNNCIVYLCPFCLLGLSDDSKGHSKAERERKPQIMNLGTHIGTAAQLFHFLVERGRESFLNQYKQITL